MTYLPGNPVTMNDRIVRRLTAAGIEATPARIEAAQRWLSVGRRLGEAVCSAVVNDPEVGDAEYRRLSRQPMLD